jgi:hypothetical protein
MDFLGLLGKLNIYLDVELLSGFVTVNDRLYEAIIYLLDVELRRVSGDPLADNL